MIPGYFLLLYQKLFTHTRGWMIALSTWTAQEEESLLFERLLTEHEQGRVKEAVYEAWYSHTEAEPIGTDSQSLHALKQTFQECETGYLIDIVLFWYPCLCLPLGASIGDYSV